MLFSYKIKKQQIEKNYPFLFKEKEQLRTETIGELSILFIRHYARFRYKLQQNTQTFS